MLRRILLAAATVAVGLTLMAAARPAPAPKLGVPHVVSVTETVPAGTPQPRVVHCPAGEVAVSFAHVYLIGGQPVASAAAGVGYRPVVTDGRPTGYEYWVDTDETVTVHATCAPVVT